jgi:hypothetical protein
MALDLRRRGRRSIERIENGEIALITDDCWPDPLDDLIEQRMRVLTGCRP